MAFSSSDSVPQTGPLSLRSSGVRQRGQCLLGQQRLDQREQASFLEPHVAFEERRELAHTPGDRRLGVALHDEFSEFRGGRV